MVAMLLGIREKQGQPSPTLLSILRVIDPVPGCDKGGGDAALPQDQLQQTAPSMLT